MPDSANQQFADRLVTQAVDIQRFSKTVFREVLGTLVRLEGDLVEAIQKMDLEGVSRDTYKRARAEKMLEQTRATIQDGYKRIDKLATERLVDLSRVEAQGIKRIAEDVFRGSVMTTALTPQDLRSIVKDLVVEGNPAREWWGRQSDGLRMNFAREVRQGLAAGETTADIVRRVRGTATGARQVVVIDGESRVLPKYSGGVMDVSTRQAEALVRSAVQAVSNDVLDETYKANKDTVEGWTLIATLDDRTCEECMGLDGGTWDFEGKPLPDSPVQDDPPDEVPVHMQCRCVRAPKTKSWAQLMKEAGTKPPKELKDLPDSARASMDGQVAGKMTYNDWLKSKPEAFQRDVLGPGKYQMWKDGKITSVSQLTDQSGNTLTLKELQARFTGDVPVPKVEEPLIPPAPVEGATPLGFVSEFGKADWVGISRAAEESGGLASVDSSDEAMGRSVEYDERFGGIADEHVKALGQDYVKSMEEYTGSGYTRINRTLRYSSSIEETGSHALVDARRVQEVILKAPPTPYDLVVYRGDTTQFQVGQVQTVRGFTSTSMNGETAYNFAQESRAVEFSKGVDPNPPTVLYEIRVPAGSRALVGHNTYETEVLLPHGAKFKVLGKREMDLVSGERKGNHAIVYELEYLGV